MFVIVVYIIWSISAFCLLSFVYAENNRFLHKRIKNNLIKYIKKELIYLDYVPKIIDTRTNTVYKKAAGLYSYIENATPLQNAANRLPRIQILNNRTELAILKTLAHEVGHHYYINNFNDSTEKSADKFVIDTFKKVLPKWEFYLCYIALIDYKLHIK